MYHCDSLFSKQVNKMYIMGENDKEIQSTTLFWRKTSSMTDHIHDSCMSTVDFFIIDFNIWNTYIYQYTHYKPVYHFI